MTIKLKKLLCIGIICTLLLPLGGCRILPRDDIRIVLTTGLTEEQVFRIDSEICSKTEYMVYLTNLQKRYEEVYGKNIWETEIPGSTMENEVKESVLRELEQIKVMKLMTGRYEVEITPEEEEKLIKVAETYFGSLSDREKEVLQVTKEDIYEMYREYLTAVKVNEHVMSGVNPEISDDEARIITVEQIGVRHYTLDKDGNRVPMDPAERMKVYKKIKSAYDRASAGEDFGTLISEYNEVGQSKLSFGHGDVDEKYEAIAFELGQGEISEIFETEDGFFLVKCISTFDAEETAKNKEKIRERYKEEAFEAEYTSYLNKVTEEINEELWPELTILRDEDITTDTFFRTFDNTFTYF